MINDLIIFLASYLVFVELGLALGYILKVIPQKAWPKYLFIIIVAGLLALLLAHIAGLLFYDTRPYIELHKVAIVKAAHDNGFPSDHMLLAATIASIVFLKSKTFGLFLWLLAILVGLGRILALVHHPIDIIASAVIAIVATVIAYYASYILPKSSLSKL